MLKFILPTGSLADAVRSYLTQAGYCVPQPDRRGFCGMSNGVEFHQLDRRTVPAFLATGKYHAGITGRDLWVASEVQGLREVCALSFSRGSEKPTRWVLAQNVDVSFASDYVRRIGCELPTFARKILGDREFRYEIVQISGSEEQCVRDGLVDMVVVMTESGSSLKANGLEIVQRCESLFESTPVILANPDLPEEESALLSAVSASLRAVVGAKKRVMIACNLPSSVGVTQLQLPAEISPTICPLADASWVSCTVCVPIEKQGEVIVQLEKQEARGIVIQNVQGFVP